MLACPSVVFGLCLRGALRHLQDACAEKSCRTSFAAQRWCSAVPVARSTCRRSAQHAKCSTRRRSRAWTWWRWSAANVRTLRRTMALKTFCCARLRSAQRRRPSATSSFSSIIACCTRPSTASSMADTSTHAGSLLVKLGIAPATRKKC